MNPFWYGKRYPTLFDLVSFGESLGYCVHVCRCPAAVTLPPLEPGDPPVILVPDHRGDLAMFWKLAHELGHAVLHTGPKDDDVSRRKNEAQASRWAACALIPQERIEHYQNASEDAFIGALSAHYEDLPLEDCSQRNLAKTIANVRAEVLRCGTVSSRDA